MLEGTLAAPDLRLAACFLCVFVFEYYHNTAYQTRSSCNLKRVSLDRDSADLKEQLANNLTFNNLL